MPGPPPDPKARRRNPQRLEWRTLPASGCDLPVPEWPMKRKPSVAVVHLWGQLWATPQATVWHELGWVRSIARYAIMVVDAEKPKAPVTLLRAVSAMEDQIGLNPMSLKRLQWIIGEPAVEPAAQQATDGPPDLTVLYGNRTG